MRALGATRMRYVYRNIRTRAVPRALFCVLTSFILVLAKAGYTLFKGLWSALAMLWLTGGARARTTCITCDS